jgi:hypothetical protein
VTKSRRCAKVDGDQAQGFFFGRPIHSSVVGACILMHFQKTLPAPPSGIAQENKMLLAKLSNER